MRYFVAIALVMAGCIRTATRSKDAEVRANLKSAYTAEKAFFQEKDCYESDVVKLGFAPERGNRYAYFFAEKGPLEDRSGPSFAIVEGLVGNGVDTFKFGPKMGIPTYRYTGCPLTTTRAGGPPLKPGIDGTGTAQTFLLTAAGNIDDDPDFDCWSIASVDRIDAKGHTIPAGEPFREHDDRNLGLWDRLFE